MLGNLTFGVPNGVNFCADTRTYGESCTSSADNSTGWFRTSALCYDTLTYIECFGGQCVQPCADNGGSLSTCPTDETCGVLAPRAEFGGADVAVCVAP